MNKKIIWVIGAILLIVLLQGKKEASADIHELSHSVSVVDNKIHVRVVLENLGDATETFLVEAQVFDENKKQSVGEQGTCDNACKFNVNRIVTMSPHRTEVVEFNVPGDGVMPNGKYYVRMVSTNQCCTLGSCIDYGPYGWGVWITNTPVTINSGSVASNSNLCSTEYCGDRTCNNGEASLGCGWGDKCNACSDCGTCQCAGWTVCTNGQQSRSCSSGTGCLTTQACTVPNPDDKDSFDFKKYLPWIIGFFVLIFGVKMRSSKK